MVMDVFPGKAVAKRPSVPETNPTSIYLLSRNGEGSKLLFRYPFQVFKEPVHDVLPSFYWDDSDTVETGLTYSDDMVQSLLGVQYSMCGHRFDVKVRNMRFVGHPMLMKAGGFMARKCLKTNVLMVHVVFALSALVHHQVADCCYELSKALAIAICHEEKRCLFYSTQLQLMVNVFENRVGDIVLGNCLVGCRHFRKILKYCRIAKDIKNVFDDVCSNNVIKLKVNNWVEVSVCLSHKVHHFYKDNMYFGPESLKKCLRGLRPYHGLLLLADRKVLLNKLSQDSSPSIVRLINMYNPVKSLQTLSADSDLTLAQVFNIAGHLIYWGDSIVIFPLSENNLYAVAPDVPTKRDNEIAKKFEEKFPEHNLLKIMSEFSFPTTIQQKLFLVEDRDNNSTMIQIVIWLLQNKILIQYHTYIYFMPSDKDYYNIPVVQDSDIDKLSEMPMTSYQKFKYVKKKSSKRSDSTIANTKQTFYSLDKSDQTTLVNIMKSSKHLIKPDDLHLLLSLVKNGYLSGEHHFEEIMFLENITRSDLSQLVEKFKQVLITVEREDSIMSNFYSH